MTSVRKVDESPEDYELRVTKAALDLVADRYRIATRERDEERAKADDAIARLHAATLSPDDIKLLRGIREDAASWKQSDAERLLLDRLIATGAASAPRSVP